MKYKIILSNSFKKDAKKINKNDLSLVLNIIDRLSNNKILESKYKNHKLKGGKYKDCLECHIKSDLLLVYK